MTIDANSEEFKRQCLVRAVLAMRVEMGSAVATEWLAIYERKVKDKGLRQSVLDQWHLGNRGDWADWREAKKGLD